MKEWKFINRNGDVQYICTDRWKCQSILMAHPDLDVIEYERERRIPASVPARMAFEKLSRNPPPHCTVAAWRDQPEVIKDAFRWRRAKQP